MQFQAFTKPVDEIVGDSIRAWEAERPEQPRQIDQKTGEVVNFLFAYRGTHLAKDYQQDFGFDVVQEGWRPS